MSLSQSLSQASLYFMEEVIHDILCSRAPQRDKLFVLVSDNILEFPHYVTEYLGCVSPPHLPSRGPATQAT